MNIKYDEITIRNAFGEAAYEYAKENENAFFICPDTLKSLGLTRVEEEYPDRCYNVGICEQNAMLMGCGIASCGGKAFVGTYAPFASMRMLEQIRTFGAYTDLDVKVVSCMSGLSGANEGVTHQGLEDISLLRAIANMVVAVPADAASARVITKKIAEHIGPTYLRIAKLNCPTVFDENYKFEIGKANVMKEGGDATIIFVGITAIKVLEAEEILKQRGYDISLIEMPCIKPIDKDTIITAAKKTGAIITVEDNNIIGGLGGAVAEVLSENCPVLMKRIGIEDCYAESGEESELLDKYGMNPAVIANRVIELIEKKGENICQ